MQINNKPSNLVIPFASGGAFNPIPTDSQIATSPNKASYTDGFPPATRTPRAAGGIPPDGLDMNGILHDLSNQMMWQQAVGILPWDSNFASKVGYPLNAIVSYNGILYQSQNDDNKATPTNVTAWGGLKGKTPPVGSNDNQFATMEALQTAINNSYGANSPPSASISSRGIALGANYSNSLSLSFTPTHTGYIVAFAKLNLSQNATTGSSVTLDLQVNGTSVSGDSTISAQSHFAVVRANSGFNTINLNVSTGSTATNALGTYAVAYIFIPSL